MDLTEYENEIGFLVPFNMQWELDIISEEMNKALKNIDKRIYSRDILLAEHIKECSFVSELFNNN